MATLRLGPGSFFRSVDRGSCVLRLAIVSPRPQPLIRAKIPRPGPPVSVRRCAVVARALHHRSRSLQVTKPARPDQTHPGLGLIPLIIILMMALLLLGPSPAWAAGSPAALAVGGGRRALTSMHLASFHFEIFGRVSIINMDTDPCMHDRSARTSPDSIPGDRGLTGIS